jgi:hypothetical protein
MSITYALVDLVETTTKHTLLQNVLICKSRNHVIIYTTTYDIIKSNIICLEYANSPITLNQYKCMSNGLVGACMHLNKLNYEDLLDKQCKINLKSLWNVFSELTIQKLRFSQSVASLIGLTIMLTTIKCGMHSAIILDGRYIHNINRDYYSLTIGKEPNCDKWHCKGNYDSTRIPCDKVWVLCNKKLHDVIYTTYIYLNFKLFSENTHMCCMCGHGISTIYNVSIDIEYYETPKPCISLRKEFR